MGAVYRAIDTKLHRDVALKVLLPEVAHDPERLGRFRREAQILASLNHPNIAHIYGLEERDGAVALVMELVTGEEPRGPMPVSDVLKIGRQIGAALDAAHERGIVHRDLKPANIKVTASGTVKVLDFGLARLNEPEPVSQDAIPTGMASPTSAGTVLGTPAYMSPEQARGKPVDKRTDIWAFGVVIYELATGDRLFDGETSSDIIAHVLTQDPDLSRVPTELRPLVAWCLQKDVSTRLRDIADAWPSMDIAIRGGSAQTVGRESLVSARSRLLWPAVSALALLAFTSLAYVHVREAPLPPPGAVRLQIRLPANVKFESSGDVIISPDGRHVAFAGLTNDGPRVVVQDFDGSPARVMPRTAIGPSAPPFFWSPDSRVVVYSDAGPKMSAVDIASGEVREICEKPGPIVGGAWNDEGVIIFGTNATGLYRVPASGGTAVSLTTLNRSAGEVSHQLPMFLPDGHRYVYLSTAADPAASGIFVRSIDDAAGVPSKLLVRSPLNARLVTDPDRRGAWLLFANTNRLEAQRLDLAKLELVGPPFVLPLRVGSAFQTALFSASSDTIVSRADAPTGRSRLVWVDPSGKELSTVGEPGQFEDARLSPDETRIAFVREDAKGSRDIWVLDLARGSTTRVTFGERVHYDPVWSPDSRDLAFGARMNSTEQIFRKHADGSGEETLVLAIPNQVVTPRDWSGDGRYLLYLKSQNAILTKTSIGIAPMQTDAPVLTFESNPRFSEANPAFSPDGRYVAYESDDTGRREVYVRALFPKPGDTARWLISTAGGHNAQFSRDGRKLYWVQPPDAWEADVDMVRGFRAGTAERRFSLGDAMDDATLGDSKGRALFIRPEAPGEADQSLQVLVNWQSALQPN
jgi:Tol biopolymer transport system component